MNRFFGLMALALLLTSCIQDRVKPYVLLDRYRGKVRVKINLHAPSAKVIYVAGTFNGWTIPRYEDETFNHEELRAYKMQRHGTLWSVVIPMSPGVHYYKFYVDFMYWKVDESSHEKTQNLNGEWRNIIVVK